MTMVVAPVMKTLTLSCSPERAFAVFTEGIATWWPLEMHSLYKADAVTVDFEAGEGGRIVERSASGEENAWGVVLVWDPPSRIVFSWAPATDKSVHTEVEVRFFSDEAGTRFELVHRGWEHLGDRAETLRSNYDGGWIGVLERFEAATA